MNFLFVEEGTDIEALQKERLARNMRANVDFDVVTTAFIANR
jgi:hypothetical protein